VGIWFQLPAGALDADLVIYDVAGRQVRALGEGARDGAGMVTNWDGAGNDGRPVAAGVYFVRLSSPRASATERVLVLR
jgi:hypothetical protein